MATIGERALREHEGGTGPRLVEFDPELCGPCPLRTRCTLSASGKGRTISIADDERLQKKLRARQSTQRGRAQLRERVGVELGEHVDAARDLDTPPLVPDLDHALLARLAGVKAQENPLTDESGVDLEGYALLCRCGPSARAASANVSDRPASAQCERADAADHDLTRGSTEAAKSVELSAETQDADDVVHLGPPTFRSASSVIGIVRLGR